MDELPADVQARIDRLSERGNTFYDKRDYDNAIATWREALASLPAPQARWSAAMWLHASIGDAQRQTRDLDNALSSFQSAFVSEDGAQNPFVQFCLGATLLDLGRSDEATDHLLRAYMMEGEEIFQGEDIKYIEHLRDKGLLF